MNSRFSLQYPNGKKAAVIFSIDDCHPAASSDGYEAGGDKEKGALGNLERLLEEHPQLRCTLFITADWREKSVVPTRLFLSKISYLKNRMTLVERWPKGKMRLDRHPDFLAYLKKLPRLELASHGLEHVGRGPEVVKEFLRLDASECRKRLSEIEKIYMDSGLIRPKGFAPPGWALTPLLLKELEQSGYSYVCCARDLKTSFDLSAVTAGSGIQGVSLFIPGYFEGSSVIHISSNWSVNSEIARADQIIQGGGVLSVKAHMTKYFFGHTSLDGLDASYTDYLSRLFSHLKDNYGDELWWATMEEVADWYGRSNATHERLYQGTKSK
ncbi:MAG: DUF2334 domain-containing protein [Candidatus Omnitrophica bacterium]|nr:DUF2334 domain-containing protein [Candidatus Omnitrophota bacterium]